MRCELLGGTEAHPQLDFGNAKVDCGGNEVEETQLGGALDEDFKDGDLPQASRLQRNLALEATLRSQMLPSEVWMEARLVGWTNGV